MIVERREGAAEHMVEPMELDRPLDGDDVGRCSTMQTTPASRRLSARHRAEIGLGEVEAAATEADALLYVDDRLSQRQAPFRLLPQTWKARPGACGTDAGRRDSSLISWSTEAAYNALLSDARKMAFASDLGRERAGIRRETPVVSLLRGSCHATRARRPWPVADPREQVGLSTLG